MRKNHGHTLLELLVVLAIMAALAAIAFPASTKDPTRKLDTAQLAVQDALDHAMALALDKAAIFGVRFDVDTECFAVLDEEANFVEDPLSHGDYIVRLHAPGEPTDVVIDLVDFGGAPVAVFNEKGVLYQSGQIRLRCGTTQRWLTVDTATAALTEIPVGP